MEDIIIAFLLGGLVYCLLADLLGRGLWRW